jgi:hypothetical protein
MRAGGVLGAATGSGSACQHSSERAASGPGRRRARAPAGGRIRAAAGVASAILRAWRCHARGQRVERAARCGRLASLRLCSRWLPPLPLRMHLLAHKRLLCHRPVHTCSHACRVDGAQDRIPLADRRRWSARPLRRAIECGSSGRRGPISIPAAAWMVVVVVVVLLLLWWRAEARGVPAGGGAGCCAARRRHGQPRNVTLPQLRQQALLVCARHRRGLAAHIRPINLLPALRGRVGYAACSSAPAAPPLLRRSRGRHTPWMPGRVLVQSFPPATPAGYPSRLPLGERDSNLPRNNGIGVHGSGVRDHI